jgi:hypothetical protein
VELDAPARQNQSYLRPLTREPSPIQPSYLSRHYSSFKEKVTSFFRRRGTTVDHDDESEQDMTSKIDSEPGTGRGSCRGPGSDAPSYSNVEVYVPLGMPPELVTGASETVCTWSVRHPAGYKGSRGPTDCSGVEARGERSTGVDPVQSYVPSSPNRQLWPTYERQPGFEEDDNQSVYRLWQKADRYYSPDAVGNVSDD